MNFCGEAIGIIGVDLATWRELCDLGEFVGSRKSINWERQPTDIKDRS